MSVILSAWKPPRADDTGARRFEALVSPEPRVVGDALTFCNEVASRLGVPPPTSPPGPALVGLEEDPRRSMSLLRRFATYADS